MRLLVAFLYETILRSDLCDINLYMADPTVLRLERFAMLFIPLSANFSWRSVHVIIIATTRIDDIKNDGIPPLRTYASQLNHYTPGSMQLDGGDLTKMHTYLCEDVIGMSVAPLLISAVASGHLKLNKFYFVFLSD